MKAAVFYGKHDVRVEETEARKPGEGDVQIKVMACGVCGTDVHIYEGAEGAAKTPPGTVLGHEFSGVVIETGAGVKTLKTGDCVCVDPNDMCGECYYCRLGKAHFCENMTGIGTTVNGGFAEYVTVPEKQTYKLPGALPFEEAAMAEPLACCLHGMDMTEIRPGHTVLIVGAGTIGLIMLQLAKISGAAALIVAEPVAAKRETAKKLGADITLDPLNEELSDVLERHSIKAIDAAVECVGSKATMSYCLGSVGRGGTAMLFGLTHPDDRIDLMPFDVFKREITIRASFINPYTQKRAVDLLGRGKIDVKSLISDVVPLSGILDVFRTDRYKGRGKIIIKP